MTLPLRAFLMLRSTTGDWSVTVHRDLDALLAGWSMRPEGVHVGLVHVGFDRPASSLFDEVASRFNSRVLVTAAARGSLPKGFESADQPVGHVDGHAIYLASRGWGYSLATDEIPSDPIGAPREFWPQGWVREFIRQHPEAEAIFRQASIQDDADYLVSESRLERSVRVRIGAFRFKMLLRPNDGDPCEVVRAAPPWLLERSFETIDLTVRISNVFSAERVIFVRDLLAYDVESLAQLRNFGRKSVRDLHSALMSALSEGPHDEETKLRATNSSTLLEEISRVLASLDERSADILKRRMGLGVPSETLNEIGVGYGITRERIRQIESKSLAMLLKSAYWSHGLLARLDALLIAREFPLPILGLDAVDPWFQGVGRASDVLRYILSSVTEDRLSVVKIGGIEYVGHITQDDWIKTLGEARRILAANVDERWTEEHCRALLDSVLGEQRREFRTVFWSEATHLCHFVDIEGGKRVLASYGRGADQAVEAVLLDSPVPLHYSEIAIRASKRSGKDFDIRRALNAAASIGILLGRGVYGLEHHVKVSDSDGEYIRDQIEQVILGGPDDRQWHSSELLAVVTERSLAGAQQVDKYSLNHVLSRSGVLKSLGRMTWMKANSSLSSRIDVRQAVVAVLQQAGRPLLTNEIRQRLVALRGVGDNFQIVSSDSVVKFDSVRWGLNDRDLVLKKADQPALLNRLEGILRDKDVGIHVSEIMSELFGKSDTPGGLMPETIMSIASMDRRFQSSPSQYVFLREWNDARRENLSSAALKALKDGPLPLEQIIVCVERLSRRVFEKRTVIATLHALEAKLDSVSGMWSAPLATSDAGVAIDGPADEMTKFEAAPH